MIRCKSYVGLGRKGVGWVYYAKQGIITVLFILSRFSWSSCYPCSAILLKFDQCTDKSESTKWWLKHIVNIIHTAFQTTVECFPCGRPQHERRMRSSIASVMNSVLECRGPFLEGPETFLPVKLQQNRKPYDYIPKICRTCISLSLSFDSCWHNRKENTAFTYVVILIHYTCHVR